MRLIERRIGLLFGGFLLCFLVIVGRAFWLQGVQGAQLASEASSQQTEVVTVPGLRGDLLDRRGKKPPAPPNAAAIYPTPYQGKNRPPPPRRRRLPPHPLPRRRPRRRRRRGWRRSSVRRRTKCWKRSPPKAASPMSPRKWISAPPRRWKRSTWKGSANFPTAVAPIHRGRWQGR